ncbi:YraN family protein, partial [Burkholderia sp. Ac-20353]|nr:YraN family protein [Burkholderia sp. Ac-20353]
MREGAQATARDDNFSGAVRSKSVGAAFEARARQFLERRRLAFVAANVTMRGGELDLVMREPDGMLVFVEVRARRSVRHGGAAAS